VACLIVALMRPQLGIERFIRRAEGIDVMLALDASGSMQAYDLPESYRTESEVRRDIQAGILRTRIEVAKEELRKFVEGRPNDRIGLIVFATLPYVASPPTLDHRFLLEQLSEINAGELGDRTGIAAPIASAAGRLEKSPAKRRVLVLFTDGDNNVEAKVTPQQAAKLAATFDVAAYTVGIGSPRSVVAVQTAFGALLQPSGAGFNEKLLREISDVTGGRYFEARDAQAFRKVMEEIDALETTALEQPTYMDYKEQFAGWLAAGLSLLLAAAIIENSVLQVVP